MNKGWIKLHRKFLEWEWYGCPKVTALFIHCILKANHTEKDWRGNTIPRGTFITSYNSLSNETGLTTRELRTAFEKLESTGEIDKQSTSVNSWVTVINYDEYQNSDNQETKERQARDKGATTTKNEKNVKNVKNVKNDNKNPISVSTNGTDFPDSCKYLDESRDIANHLLESITKYDPTHKYAHNKPAIDSWVLDIERAMRLDRRTKEQMVFIIDYIFEQDTKVADFWKPNIQSGKKLRQQFDKIKTQIKNDHKPNSKKPTLKDRLEAFS